MIQKNILTTPAVNTAALGTRMLLGAGIGLLLISIFLAGAGEPNPSWPKLWMIRPLVIVPLAGACGGAFFYFMQHLTNRGGWKRAFANILSLFVFIIGLWLGAVLGLDGTMWD